jgi:mannose-1-phosphate guanylyltransferase
MKKVAVVMAGGMGARLWPRSTEKQPKQFIHLVGEGTMIQNTIQRLLPVFPAEDIYVVTTENLSHLAKEQLYMLPVDNLIFEPFAKQTAPCLALVASILDAKYPADTVMCCFPSDHVISNVMEFHQSVETACTIAYDKSGIVAIGITPKRAETSFGYVQMKEDKADLGELYEQGVRYASAFAEKPDFATARRFIESGDFLWNSGIFIWKLETLWQAFKKHLPDDIHSYEKLKKCAVNDDFRNCVETVYKQVQSVSVDYAIMEKAKNVFVVKSSFSWSDVSNWDEIYRLSMKDGRNNVIEGDVFTLNCSNCMVTSNGKIIGIVGINNLYVVESDEAILICQRGSSDEVKEVVDYLKRKQLNNFL